MHSHLKFKKLEVNSGVSAVISHHLFNYKLLIQINGYITILFLALAAPAVASSCLLLESDRPKLSTANTGPYLTSEENLARGKRLYDSGDPFYIELVEELLEEADTHLDRELYSVTYQEKGEFIEDHHDYVSFYSYAWPNPDSEDGMPWISRDGQINREQVDRYDRSYLSRLSLAVEKLSLAWVYSREEKYAEKAADFIRTWFLDPETRMNPHLRHAQFWPGRNDGGLQGIIEGREFIPIIEGATMIYDSQAWTPEDHRELKYWFYDFMRWVQRVYNNEVFADSNVGTWIDTQKTIYALFTEHSYLLYTSKYLLPIRQRIDRQITSTGEQPVELNRATSNHYTWFNLKAYILQTEMRRHANVIPGDFAAGSIYMAHGEEGSLIAALDWLLPYVSGQRIWHDDHPALAEFNTCRYIDLFRPVANGLAEPRYEKLVQQLIGEYGCHSITTLLTHPPLEHHAEFR